MPTQSPLRKRGTCLCTPINTNARKAGKKPEPPSKKVKEEPHGTTASSCVEQVPPFNCPVHPLLTLRQTSGDWIYLYCPEESCAFSCPIEKFQLIERLFLEQVHCEVRTYWESMQCFCQKRVRLRLSQTTKNPNRLFLSCRKKECDFFQWIDTTLSLKFTDHLLENIPVKQEPEKETLAAWPTKVYPSDHMVTNPAFQNLTRVGLFKKKSIKKWNSTKRRRTLRLNQTGAGFWRGLHQEGAIPWSARHE